MSLNEVEDLFEQGKYEELLDLISKLEEEKQLTKLNIQERIEWIYYHSRTLERKGLFEESLQVALQGRNMVKEINHKDNVSLQLPIINAHWYALFRLGRFDQARILLEEGEVVLKNSKNDKKATNEINKKHMAVFLNNQGILYRHGGDLQKALEHHEKSLEIRRGLKSKVEIAGSLNNIANVYRSKGNLRKALDFRHQALAFAKETGNKYCIRMSIGSIGITYALIGELSKGIDYLKQSLDIAKEIGNKQRIAQNLADIGYFYLLRGNLEKTLKSFNQALELDKEIGNNYDIAHSYANLGKYYYYKGDFDEAVAYYDKGLRLFREVKSRDIYTTRLKFELLLIYVNVNNIEQAQKISSQITEDHSAIDSDYTLLLSQIAQAMVLKNSIRMRDKLEAQKTFEDVVEEEVIDYEMTFLALIGLCELNILELQTNAEYSILKNTKKYVNKLYEYAQDQHSHIAVIEALLLRAQVALLEGSLQETQKLFDQAMITAEERKLGLLIEKINVQRKEFETKFNQWQDLINSNATLQERLKQSKILDYIRRCKIMIGEER
jgi:tetratricopeptide (TPR) repeat protein